MIHWYRKLYMDEVVSEHPKRCKRDVMHRKPWKKSYFAITLATNPDNLFEIMETRQLFFRRYSYLDLYVVGLAVNYENAVALLQQILLEMESKEGSFITDKYFPKNEFIDR